MRSTSKIRQFDFGDCRPPQPVEAKSRQGVSGLQPLAPFVFLCTCYVRTTRHARGPRQAHLEGFDLHAKVWGSQRPGAAGAGVQIMRSSAYCRYVVRPPLAENRLRRRADGRVRLELKRPWSDGTA